MADVMQFDLAKLDTRDKALAFYGRVRNSVMECYEEMPDFLKHYADILAPLELSVLVTGDDVEEADSEADNVWRGMSYEIQAGMLSLKRSRRDAARVIHNVFSKHGDPTELDYAKEYAILAQLLEDLKAIDEVVLHNARMKDWMEDLEDCCSHFNLMNDIENSITDEEDEQNQAFAEVRLAYAELVNMLNKMDKADEAAEQAELEQQAVSKAIENLNALIAEFNA